jgi:glucose-1-phosphate adenylyltransferase
MKDAALLKDTLTFILGGGQGDELYPLTKNRPKPAVPFGGQYRVIDFVLSNCVNSGLKRIFVLTQSKNHSLERHLKQAWNIFPGRVGDFLFTVPPQFRIGTNWYQGSADAVFQNIYILQLLRPARLLILSGDHVYKMDYSRILEAHVARGALATIATVECDRNSARRMGVLQVDAEGLVVSFDEKPPEPKPMPGKPDVSLVNMGVYVFETAALVQAVCENARRQSSHALGPDVVPDLVRQGKVYAHPFLDENGKEQQYWRDLPNLDSYYAAGMDLVHVDPILNLYDRLFPIHSAVVPYAPAKLIANDSGPSQAGVAVDSMICDGCVIRGARVERSILSPKVCVEPSALVEDSIVFDRVEIGQGAKIRKAIIDKDVKIPNDFRIGYDPEEDRKRFTVTESGVVVIPQREML